MAKSPLLTIENLDLAISGTPILKDVSLSVRQGEIVGIVGESGSGKSLTALSTMQLLPEGSETGGRIRFAEHDILSANDVLMQDLRGDDMAMIFQEPMTALNPVQSIGDQVAEGMMLHEGLSRREALSRAGTLLDRVGLPPSRYPLDRFPHELSGGQRQRVMIAMACAQQPDLLIADEPTTALDVTLQAQILDLLRDLVDERGMGLLLISHDLAVVAGMTDRLVIMRDGMVMDEGPTVAMLRQLRHPYTAQLARASSHVPKRSTPPVLSEDRESTASKPLLRVENLVRDYPQKRTSLFKPAPPMRAVDQVSFNLYPGQNMGLVGESGCGKSTLARMVLALDRPTSGTVSLQEQPVDFDDKASMQSARSHMQVVFQDPYASFDPRHTMLHSVSEPLHLDKDQSRTERRDRVLAALHEVGMDERALDKYPHEFSGGQRQRLAIARALITRPSLIVADEPVSALDVSIRAQVLDLLVDLRDRLGIAFLFISHDLGVVRAICDEVLVMDEGRIVEQGPVSELFGNPQSEAAQKLVAATPNLERALSQREESHGH